MRTFEDDFDFKFEEGETVRVLNPKDYRKDTCRLLSFGTVGVKTNPKRELRVLAHQRRIQRELGR